MRTGRAAWAVDRYSSKGWIGYGVALIAVAVLLLLVMKGPLKVVVPVIMLGGAVVCFVQSKRAAELDDRT